LLDRAATRQRPDAPGADRIIKRQGDGAPRTDAAARPSARSCPVGPGGDGRLRPPAAGPRRRSRRIFACLPTPGYRGHPITKSRTYSVTFGQIRRARQRFRQNPAGLDPEADIRQVLDADDDLPDGFVLESTRVFIGKGYLDLDQAAVAVTAAMLARSR
jgi:replication initiator protein RepSA